ncbi:MAG: hypothetical protein FJZ63_00520 [Chlamydiae bacterium]|nr:hypothetical protein [Chlamydiota bacterium]
MRKFLLGIMIVHLVFEQAWAYRKQSFSQVSLQHREHKGVGYNDGYSTLGWFFSPNVSPFATSFLDARLHVFNDAYLASNMGLGARFASRDQKYTVGLNAYYDYRNYRSLSSHQVASGFEVLSEKIDFRVNGYYPFSGLYQDYPFLFGGFKNHEMMIRQKVLYALPCADCELGMSLPDPCDQIGLYLALGGYYLFKQKGFNQSVGNVPGGKVRLLAHPAKYLSLGVDYTYDKLFRGRASGFIALNIPIGLPKLKKLQKELTPHKDWVALQTKPVVRSEIIPFIAKTHRFAQRNYLGDSLHFIFVDNSRSSSREQGTFENPYTTLAAAEKEAMPGDYIYVFFGNGSSSGYDTGFTFQKDQTLLGSGSSAIIGNVEVPALTPGLLPLITKPQGAVLKASSAVHIALQGVRVEAQEGEALLVDHTEVALSRNEFKGVSQCSLVKIENALGKNYIGANQFYGEGVGSAPMLDLSQQEEGSGYYSVEHNTFIAQEEEMGIKLSNIEEASICYNTFIGMQPSGVALRSEALQGQRVQQSFRYNKIESGFEEALQIEMGELPEEMLVVEHNDFASGTLVKGVSYQSQASQRCVKIAANHIVAGAEGLVVDLAQGEGRLEVVDNLFYGYSGTPCIAVKGHDGAEVLVKDNELEYAKRLKGTFFGVDCQLLGDNNRLAVVGNTIHMNSANEGINILGDGVQAAVVSNQITTKGGLKGVQVTHEGLGDCMLYVEKEALPVTLINKGPGTMQLQTASQERIVGEGETFELTAVSTSSQG